MEAFSSTAAAEISGMPQPTVMHLAASGLLEPSLASSSGRGTSGRYSFGDVCALRFATEARAFGMPVVALRNAIVRLQSLGLDEKGDRAIFLVARSDGSVGMAAKDQPLPEHIVEGKKKPSLIQLVIDVDELTDFVTVEALALKMRGTPFEGKRGRPRKPKSPPEQKRAPSDERGASADIHSKDARGDRARKTR
jgi:DNA-binding transcriptional MerR regulator